MRKKKTKSKKSKKFKKVKKKKKNFKRKLPKKRKIKSKSFNKRKKKRRSKRKKYPSRKITKETFRKILRFSNRITPEFKFNFNIDRALQNFFQRISNTIKTLKQVIEEEREKNIRDESNTEAFNSRLFANLTT